MVKITGHKGDTDGERELLPPIMAAKLRNILVFTLTSAGFLLDGSHDSIYKEMFINLHK